MQRLVSFFVMFHEMGKRCQDFWSNVSFGMLGYDMSRTQSIMRIATTASPVSGMEVRLRVIELQRQQEMYNGARCLAMRFRFRRAMKADEETLMGMAMKGQLTQTQLSQVLLLKSQEAEMGKRRGGIVDSASPLLEDASSSAAVGSDLELPPKTLDQTHFLMEVMKGCSAFNWLGPQRIRAAVDLFQVSGATWVRDGCRGGVAEGVRPECRWGQWLGL